MTQSPALMTALHSHRKEAYLLLREFTQVDENILSRNEIIDLLTEFENSESGKGLVGTAVSLALRLAQEALVFPNQLAFFTREQIGSRKYLLFDVEQVRCREISTLEYLELKEQFVLQPPDDNWSVNIDLEPFQRGFPKMRDEIWIGRGVEFLNRHLSSRMFAKNGESFEPLVNFLKVHHFDGQKLMVNDRIEGGESLRKSLKKAKKHLSSLSPQTRWSDFAFVLQELGFEPGWGKDAETCLELFSLLSEILEAPAPTTLETFLAAVPMVFRIAILSPHGYFGQSQVLGKPDTGGQVVYILDQVRALEKEMRTNLVERGLEIEPQIVVLTRLFHDEDAPCCAQRLESILGTTNARILRVPFRTGEGDIVPQWISRFNIWPYLERFAVDSETELLAELGGKPDFIIGNYSDGNLVASILAHRLQVTQCNIAHALEKTKYRNSDVNWKTLDNEYHFSCQFTADLIAMNTADFIITSTYQEIAGTGESVGQYESYSSFTMPELYRVTSGIDTFDPKFNIVSPGADSDVFFPFSDTERRLVDLHPQLEKLVYTTPECDYRGTFAERDKPIVFAMSRLDPIKNVVGLTRLYAEHEELRENVNLFLVAGEVSAERSSDRDETRLIEEMHEIFDKYKLDSHARWVVGQTDKNLVGELYRYIADAKGVFVQPALFEAFGLTVIEAMSSGLPTFATCHGGPLEIVVNDESGFHIDPNHEQETAQKLFQFFERCEEQSHEWKRISDGGIERVREHYTWELYAKKLMTLSRIYGFWKYISSIEREETRRYLEMLYGFMYRPLAKKLAR